jgi:chromate transporter
MKSAWECFRVALRLGLTSFGGPVAHLAYFREEYVTRRQWLSEERFGELMLLTQFLPGPGSSQLGAAIGNERAGLPGAFAAWLGFTLPSAILLVLLALGMGDLSGDRASGALTGLKLVALAVVAGAWIGMRRSLAPDFRRLGIALLVLVTLWFFPAPWMTLTTMMTGALAGMFFLPREKTPDVPVPAVRRGGRGWLALLAFFLLLGLSLGHPGPLAGIYRAGSLVFGGGHVVLPLLQESMVDGGYLSQDVFLGGYGATQAVPGPVFTFAAFLGVKAGLFGHPVLGAAAALVAVFLPGMLLLGGTLHLWSRLRERPRARGAVSGANAAVVGVLGVALLRMATDGTIDGWGHALGVAILFLILRRKLIPVWALVIISAVGGAVLA